MPPYLVACVCTVALGWASDRVGQRGIFIAGVLPTAIVGFAMLRWTDSASAKYAAVFLNAIGCFAASAGMLSWGINSESSPSDLSHNMQDADNIQTLGTPRLQL